MGLRREQLCSVQERFEVIASRHHGHVAAVLTTMRRLGLETLIASRHSRERDLVLAMIAARTKSKPARPGAAAAKRNDLRSTQGRRARSSHAIFAKFTPFHVAGNNPRYHPREILAPPDLCPRRSSPTTRRRVNVKLRTWHCPAISYSPNTAQAQYG
jgi:hypothetical protein